MKKTILIIVLFFLVNCAKSYAQSEISRITRFPTLRALYYDSKMGFGEPTNIPRFFSEWAEWSELISKGAPDSQYNEIFSTYFLKYYGSTDTMFRGDKGCKYVALPDRIRVIKFNCNISPDSLRAIEVDGYTRLGSLLETVLPEYISYFTPKIDLDKQIVYLTSEATDIVDSFIDEPIKDKAFESISEEDWSEHLRREGMIKEYIPVIIAHWGDGWYYSSYPLFGTIFVGNDGYYVEISDANYSGIELFVTWGGEEQVVSEWIQ